MGVMRYEGRDLRNEGEAQDHADCRPELWTPIPEPVHELRGQKGQDRKYLKQISGFDEIPALGRGLITEKKPSIAKQSRAGEHGKQDGEALGVIIMCPSG